MIKGDQWPGAASQNKPVAAFGTSLTHRSLIALGAVAGANRAGLMVHAETIIASFRTLASKHLEYSSSWLTHVTLLSQSAGGHRRHRDRWSKVAMLSNKLHDGMLYSMGASLHTVCQRSIGFSSFILGS